MVTAPARREVVREMVTQGLSERRALTVAHMSAATLRYVARPDPDPRTHADAATAMVSVGGVRYTSSQRAFQQLDGLAVSMTTTDLPRPENRAVWDDTDRQVQYHEDRAQDHLRIAVATSGAAHRANHIRSEWRVCERERTGRGRTVGATWRKWHPINRKRVAPYGR